MKEVYLKNFYIELIELGIKIEQPNGSRGHLSGISKLRTASLCTPNRQHLPHLRLKLPFGLHRESKYR